MLCKKLFLFSLLASSFTPAKALSTHEIRTWGIVGAGLILTSTGAHMIHRYDYDISHRVFNTLVGAALITAGLYGIVASDKVIKIIERSFR